MADLEKRIPQLAFRELAQDLGPLFSDFLPNTKLIYLPVAITPFDLAKFLKFQRDYWQSFNAGIERGIRQSHDIGHFIIDGFAKLRINPEISQEHQGRMLL